ncbi:MAG TPA: M15 family metallopeptidase [Polyangia bacterium]
MSKGYRAEVEPIPAAWRTRMTGASWHADPRCPPLEDLRLLRLDHWTFTNDVATGTLVVAKALADEVVAIFERVFAARFPIERMEPIDVFAGDDDASMAANNTSAFNFRVVAGTAVLSQHAFGVAIDINPRLNPMVVGTAVHPPNATEYLDREHLRPGMIVRPGPVVEAFAAFGWQWGGDWSPLKDYHHFVKGKAPAPKVE